MSAVSVVVFDVGETLIDETRHWAEWADWLGVPHFTFFAALGAVIARGEPHRRAFQLVRPGIDVDVAILARQSEGWTYRFEPADFYPDALPCLAALRREGRRVGVAGNQPEAAEATLEAVGLGADFIASSARWGVEKPDPGFFAKVIDAAGVPAAAIAYVGDRLDNDVLPAKRAGMRAVFIRRGPWGVLHASLPEAAQADVRLESLVELPAALARLGQGA